MITYNDLITDPKYKAMSIRKLKSVIYKKLPYSEYPNESDWDKFNQFVERVYKILHT